MPLECDLVQAIIKASSDGSEIFIEACSCNNSLGEEIGKDLKPNNMFTENWVQLWDSNEILQGMVTLY